MVIGNVIMKYNELNEMKYKWNNYYIIMLKMCQWLHGPHAFWETIQFLNKIFAKYVYCC